MTSVDDGFPSDVVTVVDDSGCEEVAEGVAEDAEEEVEKTDSNVDEGIRPLVVLVFSDSVSLPEEGVSEYTKLVGLEVVGVSDVVELDDSDEDSVVELPGTELEG